MERRSPALQDTRARIDECLQRAKLAGPQVRVVPLTGDASTRQYFRILRPDNPSVVLAVYDAPFVFNELPFVNVCRLFTAIPLPVPAIAGHADDLGILILEDLGDVTLQAHLGMTQPAEHDALYRQAVEFIFRMQRRGAELQSDEYIPYGIAFDRDKLMWELNFFVKHFLEAYRGMALTPAVGAALEEESRTIAEELASEPRVLCHRDYHSRNLMVHDRRLYIIDFQDARMGPDTYDLVSLLRDSYVDFTEARVDELIRVYLKLGGAAHATPEAFAEYRRRFDVMSVQRNLKALGTFGHQTTSRNNTVYIQYIPRTLSYVRTNLERYPRFARLRELLAPVL
ncbi:MAG TPA: phosphotransferase [Vicinamibacterales bacterium]|nr:phosphotransferase [Vicinamibacterales bacterium]